LAAQLRLTLDRPPVYRREEFICSPSNAVAVQALEAWPAWPGGALVLVGPAGSGKTHLAEVWAERSGARRLPAEWSGQGVAELAGAVLLEDADRRPAEEGLFHLINMAARPGGSMLMTARTPPALWPTELADLRSRLNALPVAELGEPDDAILQGVLAKFFRERSILPSEDLLAYLVRRIERSVPRARDIVERLDETADAEGRPVSRALARDVLGAEAGDEPGED
jgi:chromosomal replication initiation ATPase DnaA